MFIRTLSSGEDLSPLPSCKAPSPPCRPPPTPRLLSRAPKGRTSTWASQASAQRIPEVGIGAVGPSWFPPGWWRERGIPTTLPGRSPEGRGGLLKERRGQFSEKGLSTLRSLPACLGGLFPWAPSPISCWSLGGRNQKVAPHPSRAEGGAPGPLPSKDVHPGQ